MRAIDLLVGGGTVEFGGSAWIKISKRLREWFEDETK
jgi:hypothetical protein